MKKILVYSIFLSTLGASAGADPQADYAAGVAQWTALKSNQDISCSPQVDSQEVLLGHKTNVSVLILHGFTQNPEAMSAYIAFFKRFNVNILAPRLIHHFDEDLKALDRVKKEQWTAQVQTAFAAASKLGSKVVIVGYSLGGLLGADLALDPRNSNSIAALVLLSPALRLVGTVEEGAMVASLFTRTGNDWLKMALPGCGSPTPYLSVNGGKEVIRLLRTDPGYPGSDNIYRMRIFAPEVDTSKATLLALVANDDVVDSNLLLNMITPIAPRGYMTVLLYSGPPGMHPHSTLTSDAIPNLRMNQSSVTAHAGSSDLMSQLTTFLRDWVGIVPIAPAALTVN